MLRWKDYGQSIANLIDRRNARSFAWNLESAKCVVPTLADAGYLNGRVQKSKSDKILVSV